MSRLTFRDPAGDVAWQKQLRDRYLEEGAPPAPHFNLKHAEVRRVSRKLAEQIILKYEWLGTLPNGCSYHFGLFFGPYCAGVTCSSVGSGGANIYAHKELGVMPHELDKLARGACTHWAPKGANSKLVAWTCKLLVGSGAKVVIAYADTDAGEIGTIYQAANFVCIGRGASTRQWIAPNGRVYDQKHPSNLAASRGGPRSGWTAALRAAGWKEQQSNPKWRYVYVMDKTDKLLVAQIEHMRQPYPRRKTCDRGEIDNAPRTNGESGGASPTRSLSNNSTIEKIDG